LYPKIAKPKAKRYWRRSSKQNANCLDQTVETMRLTSRLTDIMAWMMAQRAVSAGTITAQEGASENFR